MDPLSVIASTIAVVEAISSTYKAIQHLRGLPNEFKEVNRNLPLAQHTLRLARDHLQGLALDESSKRAIEPVVSSCEEKAEMLRQIFTAVEKRAKDAKDGSMLELYRTCLLRLGKAHRVESLMQDILGGLDVLASNQSFKMAAQLQIQTDQLKKAIEELSNVESCVPDSDFDRGTNSQHIASGGTGYQSNIEGKDHKINSGSGKQYVAQTMTFVQSDNTWRDIIHALHTSPYLDRKNRNPDRVPGTCEWFVRHERFERWRESETSSLLWVSADPGCGKSVLAKYLVESELQTTKSRTTCYFFFKDDFEDQKSANSALSCILHQLFTQREDLISDRIRKRLEANEAQLSNSFDELWEILMMASQDNKDGELICVLDAFDECGHQRDKLAQALSKFYGATTDFNLKFLVTCRPYEAIQRQIAPLHISELPVIHLKGHNKGETGKIAKEIEIYIKERVSGIQRSLRLQPDEALLLLDQLLSVPNRTYLWVYLTLESIERDIRIDKTLIRKISSSLPRNVDDAYERILARSQNPAKAKKLLQIVVAAARPLTLDEMQLALALGEDHKSEKDALRDRQPVDRFRRYMRDLCGLFVTITDLKVYLLHQTAKEFLVSKEDNPRVDHNNQGKWKSSLRLTECHKILCQISIWHLLFPEFSADCSDEPLDNTLSHYVFLDYSAKNWAIHFRESHIKENAVIESVRRICDVTRYCPTWFKIYWSSTHKDTPQDFTTLMIASYFGLEQIVCLLLETGDNKINSRDGTHGRSALSWASENGYDGVVKRLTKRLSIFRRGVKVDAEDKYGRTSLSYAAWNGHEVVVQRLCEVGARVNAKDHIGGTPISYALCSGHETVVQLLLKGAKHESADKLQRELLASAAKGGDDAVVKRLLDRSVAPGLVDSTNRTPLSYAAESGHFTVTQLLLDKGVEVNDSQTRRTPLAWAIESDSEDTIHLLLKKGAKVDCVFGLVNNEKRFVSGYDPRRYPRG